MRQRTISDFFWRDPAISDLSQEDKATLLYFLTSPSSNIIGCYQVVWGIAAAEMGWTKDQLIVVIKRLQAKDLIDFNEAGWVWVKVWWKHNSPGVALSVKSKLIQHAKKQCATIPLEWVNSFGKSLEQVGVDTQAIEYPYDAPYDAPYHAPYHAPSDAPYDAPSDAPSKKTQSPSNQGLDAPSDAPSDAPYHGGRGNRYLVSKTTTTPNPSFRNTENTNGVVVGDLIFPDGLPLVQQDAILAMLEGSDVAPEHWQPILDELAGAIRHGLKTSNPITNPAGYVRGMAKRAESGNFLPEKGVVIVAQRDMQKTLEQRDAEAIREVTAQLSDTEIERLPASLRDSLSRILTKQNKEYHGA